MDIVVTILSVLLSGILSTVITIIYQRYSEEARAKREIFQTAVSYRFSIAEEENVRSLNSIDVVFHKHDHVRKAWKAYMDEAYKAPPNEQNIKDKYIKLLEEMAVACGYKDVRWDDLKKVYYPNGLQNRKAADESLLKLQIKTAEQSLSKPVSTGNNQLSDDAMAKVMVELLPKLLENPQSLDKLMALSEKGKK